MDPVGVVLVQSSSCEARGGVCVDVCLQCLVGRILSNQAACSITQKLDSKSYHR